MEKTNHSQKTPYYIYCYSPKWKQQLDTLKSARCTWGYLYQRCRQPQFLELSFITVSPVTNRALRTIDRHRHSFTGQGFPQPSADRIFLPMQEGPFKEWLLYKVNLPHRKKSALLQKSCPPSQNAKRELPQGYSRYRTTHKFLNNTPHLQTWMDYKNTSVTGLVL